MRTQIVIGIEGDKRHIIALDDEPIVSQLKKIKDIKLAYGKMKVGKADVQLDAVVVYDTGRTFRFKALPKPAAKK